MKSVFARRLLIAAVLTASFTAIAQDATVNALSKLQNVITNNVPSQYRGDLLDKAADVDQAAADLTRSLKKLDNVVNNSLPKEQRDLLNTKILAVKSAIAQDLTGAQVSISTGKSYCAAACKSVYGEADMNYSSGINADSTLEGKSAAMAKLRSDYTCNYGGIDAGCEAEGALKTCAAGCRTVYGELDSTYWTTAKGSSTLEAKVEAVRNAKSQFNCSYGIIVGACE